MLAGEVKQICIDRATDWLIDLKQRRDQMEDSVADFLAPDAI